MWFKEYIKSLNHFQVLSGSYFVPCPFTSPLHVCTGFLGQWSWVACPFLLSLLCMSPALGQPRICTELISWFTFWHSLENCLAISYFLALKGLKPQISRSSGLSLFAWYWLHHFNWWCFTSREPPLTATGRLLIFMVCPILAELFATRDEVCLGVLPTKNAI